MFYGLFDLAELDALATNSRWFSHNGFNLISFHDADHGPDDGSDLDAWARGILDAHGLDLHGGSIRVLAFPRVLGYVFNPITEWFCYDSNGALAAMIHEVRNTFGDKHCYVGIGDAVPDHAVGKRLHVSPFMPMDQRYEFTVTPPNDRVSVAIRLLDTDGELFRASLAGSRVPFSDRNILKLFFTHPLVTLRVIAAIHVQAVRLWRKRVPFHRRPAPPTAATTTASRAASTTARIS